MPPRHAVLEREDKLAKQARGGSSLKEKESKQKLMQLGTQGVKLHLTQENRNRVDGECR